MNAFSQYFSGRFFPRHGTFIHSGISYGYQNDALPRTTQIVDAYRCQATYERVSRRLLRNRLDSMMLLCFWHIDTKLGVRAFKKMCSSLAAQTRPTTYFAVPMYRCYRIVARLRQISVNSK